MNLVSEVKTDINMREVTFSFDAEEFEKACDQAYQHAKKNITIKGFRKGKAPRKLVERTYGEDVFYEDAVNQLLPETLDKIVSDLGVTLVDRPSVELVSCSKEEGAVCKAVLITKPEVTGSEYKGIRAPMVIKEVTDEDVNQQVEMFRQRQARQIDVDDRPAQLGDEVKINFEGFIDDVAFEGGKGEDYQLRLGSGQFIPGFEDQIVGHEIGEKFDINVTFPENYGDERYAAKPAVFKIELLAISTQELPEVDDEFAKDVSTFDTVEEWKADIREKLTERAKQAGQNGFENIVFDKLIANTDAVVPNVMNERRIDQMMHEFEHQLRHQYGDLSLEEYLQFTGMTVQQMRDTYEEDAKKQVLLRLALEKIVEIEQITVSDEELDEALTDLGAQYQMPLEAVKARIPVADYRMDMCVNKAVELVKNNAVVDNSLLEEETAADETAEAETTETATEE